MSAPLPASVKARIGGAALLGAGIVCLKIAVLDVLAAARSSHAPVTTYMKATIVAPLFVGVGLLLLAIGAPREPKPRSLVLHFVTGHGEQSRLKPLGYGVLFIMLGLGFALHAWVGGELRKLGYE